MHIIYPIIFQIFMPYNVGKIYVLIRRITRHNIISKHSSTMIFFKIINQCQTYDIFRRSSIFSTLNFLLILEQSLKCGDVFIKMRISQCY